MADVNSPIIIFGAAILVTALAGAALADDSDDLLAVVQSGKCPEKLEKISPVKSSEFCKGVEGRDCNETSTSCFDELNTCWKQVSAMNKEIFTYNIFINKCSAQAAAAAPPPAPPPPATPAPKKPHKAVK
jgi:hypothetical protein